MKERREVEKVEKEERYMRNRQCKKQEEKSAVLTTFCKVVVNSQMCRVHTA